MGGTARGGAGQTVGTGTAAHRSPSALDMETDHDASFAGTGDGRSGLGRRKSYNERYGPVPGGEYGAQ